MNTAEGLFVLLIAERGLGCIMMIYVTRTGILTAAALVISNVTGISCV